MNRTEKETGRMTFSKFIKLYSHYKNNFDFELSCYLNKTMYKDTQEKYANYQSIDVTIQGVERS